MTAERRAYQRELRRQGKHSVRAHLDGEVLELIGAEQLSPDFLADLVGSYVATALYLERAVEEARQEAADLAALVDGLVQNCRHRRVGGFCANLDCTCRRAHYAVNGPIE